MYKTCSSLQAELDRAVAKGLSKKGKKPIGEDYDVFLSKMSILLDVQQNLDPADPDYLNSLMSTYKRMFAVLGSDVAAHKDVFEQLERLSARFDSALNKLSATDGTLDTELSLTSKLYKWYKREGVLFSDLRETFRALYQLIPDIVVSYQLSCLVDPHVPEDQKVPLATKESWQTALSTAVACGRILLGNKEFDSYLTFKNDDKMLQVLLLAYSVLRYSCNSYVETCSDVISVEAAEALKKDFQKILAEYDALKSRNDSLVEQNEKLVRAQRSADASVTVPLEKQIRALQEENAVLQEELKAYSALRQVEESLDEDEDSGTEICSEELLDLPLEDVSFVGGSSTLRTKISQKFPGWTVVPSNTSGNWSGKIMFLLTSSISHKCYWNILSKYKGTVLCIRGQNLELLENKMRQEYTKYCRDNI